MYRLFRYLDINGDGTGSKNANVEGSLVAPIVFRYNPTGTVEIHRMIAHIRCGRVGFSADAYGDISELTNGVKVEVRDKKDDSVILDLCDGLPFTNNTSWGRACYDVTALDFGAGDRFVNVRWTFAKAGKPLYLGPTEYFAVTIQDDLTDLVHHSFMVQGH